MKKKMAAQSGSLLTNMTHALKKINKKAISDNVMHYIQIVHKSLEIEKEREMLYMELSEVKKWRRSA